MIPEEDLRLCAHEFAEAFNGSGVSKDSPYKVYLVFYCIYCLDIRIKSYDQSRFSLSKEFLEQYKDDNGEGVV